jgi:hypothetical protein
MSKLTDSTKNDKKKPEKKFEKAQPEKHETYNGKRDGESLTKVYQPPTPDLNK